MIPTISELFLHDTESKKLDEVFNSILDEADVKIEQSVDWPMLSENRSVITRRGPCLENGHQFFQRQSVHSKEEATYDQLRQVLLVNHSLNKAKYIEGMSEARELEKLTQHAGVYWMGFKATLVPSREYLELVVTKEDPIARRFTIVSKPVEYSQEPLRQGHVRAAYESWQVVQEITQEDGEKQVEWICVQRSMAGGWIPWCLSDWITGHEFHKEVDSIIQFIKGTGVTQN
ncbi:hypothetical protein DFQ28_003193 [Apophysomyces sp. BC1034]|nr:hypothetical protein DFQ30_000042 [Apophysomyces sp. BC1015]KAG0183421.1 hypothetical protein DFQ29_004365 [Apophysomyces sp. BC1021]KAG0193789.1 hypothetical protein DFQ28_003193 [Apophysomyces sp. BC1034]